MKFGSVGRQCPYLPTEPNFTSKNFLVRNRQAARVESVDSFQAYRTEWPHNLPCSVTISQGSPQLGTAHVAWLVAGRVGAEAGSTKTVYGHGLQERGELVVSRRPHHDM